MQKKQHTLTFFFLVLAFFAAPIYASAVWTPLQNTEVSPYVTAYQGAFSDNIIAGTQFTATSTFSLQEFNLRLCKSTGSTGNLVIQIATGTLASYTVVATSDAESFAGMNDCSPGAPTTTMAFHNFSFGGNIYQFVSGTPVVFIASTTNPSPSAYGYLMTIDHSTEFSYWGNATGTWRECINYLANGAGCRGDGYPRAWYFTVSTAGRAPANTDTTYNAVIDNYEDCDDLIDIGCHLTNAFVWLFYPSIPISDQFATLAATANNQIPFGYITDISSKFTEYSTTGTSTFSLSIELSPLMNFLGGTYSSSSITILSGSGLRSTLGATMWNFIQGLMVACLWAGFMFYIYRRSMTLL